MVQDAGPHQGRNQGTRSALFKPTDSGLRILEEGPGVQQLLNAGCGALVAGFTAWMVHFPVSSSTDCLSVARHECWAAFEILQKSYERTAAPTGAAGYRLSLLFPLATGFFVEVNCPSE